MKVLQLIPPSTNSGRIGAYGFLDEELLGLAGLGVEVLVISPAINRPEIVSGVRLIPVPRGRTIRGIALTTALLLRHHSRIAPATRRPLLSLMHAAWLERFAADVIRRERVDVVHSHFGWPRGFGGVLAARDTAVPLVASFRGMDLFVRSDIDYGLRRDPAFDAAVRELLRSADCTLYWGESTRRLGIELGADPEKAKVLRKGVDVSRFRVARNRENLLKQLDIRPPMIFSAASRLIKRKGFDTALRALARLKESHDFTYVICGDGGERRSLEALAGALGIEDRVRFVGLLSREQIAAYFAACDVYVLPSILEAAGNVVLEAMASGRPVICTDSGGPPEYVEHGATGLVVPPSDVERLSDAVRLMLDEPERRENYGRAARRTVESELSYGQMLDTVVQVYTDLTAAVGSQ